MAWLESFRDKSVLVTGASSGIGRATALAFGAAGARVALALPGVVETPMVEQISHDEEFLDLWPSALNMPPSWVVWAIFAAARFRLIEVSVPPGAATFEKLAALAPGMTDTLVRWAKQASHWLTR